MHFSFRCEKIHWLYDLFKRFHYIRQHYWNWPLVLFGHRIFHLNHMMYQRHCVNIWIQLIIVLIQNAKVIQFLLTKIISNTLKNTTFSHYFTIFFLGVFFDSRVEHIKFVDFCGRYRIPLLQYLCSSRYIFEIFDTMNNIICFKFGNKLSLQMHWVG